ncbi:RNase P subunit [Yamadazyma tenuis]|uniref:Uncharacterized protein n=1 Tax=Candida tenuis (strain ATCC 10573 / BCRC 21748 / CBS 615 / JCM 9827 / NBRC 10315 / NRRL Y-1498 / VKM Y-70) TaxID=590646 RepID=G3AYV1_CANTC|nr:uncharacterized protein CANTEDRAFT_92280 [Yamadazyma tenuis ATCC 10573]EGV65935.1 hypothetical protein CANTEDRAFT_92280 [Yamadazyma tenuis ATCC 10573]WEJ95733.1 RNase P subunit [Yamadazyma tenuis]
MVFCSFIRCKYYPVHIKFFQSSSSYLHNQSLTRFYRKYTRIYKDHDPHPSRQSNSYLNISAGHYGLYFTIFNRDAEKHSSNSIDIISFDPQLQFMSPTTPSVFTKFHISGLNQHMYNNMSELKSQSKSLRSPSSLVSKRAFSTFVSSNGAQASSPLVTSVEDAHKSEPLEYDDFESFKTTQISKINSLFEEEDYNLIFPIYQSLKRNHMGLGSTELYNKVLSSLLLREFDNSMQLEDIEIRLTNLLTVYQDFLFFANEQMKPDFSTYNIVIGGLLKGSLDSVTYNKSKNLPTILYNQSFIKSQEFALIALELLHSVKDVQQLDLNKIYPLKFEVLNQFPNLVNKELMTLVFNNLLKNTDQFQYYNQLIRLTSKFQSTGVLNSDEDCYNFIFHVYNSYQEMAVGSFTKEQDYIVYESLVTELIKINNLEVATKFLDSILLSFKSSYKAEDKEGISNLLSGYLSEISNHNLTEAYKLMKEFNAVNFIPELSMSLNNELIDKFIGYYYSLETSKNNANYESVCAQQQDVYYNIWDIVNYNLIRQDFQLNHGLISLVVDLNDYDNIYKLTKILLINEELIDLQAFKKLLDYFASGMSYNFNTYYELILKLIEHQAQFYNDYGKINDYFSEVVDYLTISSNEFVVHNLINSPLIEEVFDKSDLVDDKIYGLIKFSKFLLDFFETNEVLEEDLLKILNYQSILINQLEDPDLTYVNLDEDLGNFKTRLSQSFGTNQSLLGQQTKSMIQSCKYLDIEVSDKPVVKVVPTVNLVPLLNINYGLGVKKFIEHFNQGYKFDDQTLFALISKEFLVNHLKRINVNKFVKLYISAGNSDLVETLVNENLDKINIAILKNIESMDDGLFSLYLDKLLMSSNKYLFEVFNSIDYTLDDIQMGKYLQLLMKHEQYQQIVDIFECNDELVNNESNLAVYLNSLLVTKQNDKFNLLVKSRFNSRESLQRLLENHDLKMVVDDYYLLSNFESNLFAPQKFKDVKDLTNQIFNQLSNEKNLRELYQLNSKLINVNQQMVISRLLAKIRDYKLGYDLLFKFCQISNIHKFSVLNLKRIIETLTKFEDVVKLNVIFNKFLHKNMSSYLKFEFFEILITSNKDKVELLKLFKNSFASLNCEINLIKIDKFVIENNISL